MGNSKITEKRTDNSFRNAHIFNEFAKALQNIGADIENSVSLFDKIGEKNEIFQKQ